MIPAPKRCGPRLKAELSERPCATCKRLLPGERYPRRKDGRRSIVCEQCHAKARLPRPCSGCATLVPPDQFPQTKNGGRSKFCAACKRLPPPPLPCLKCKKQLPREAFTRYRNGVWARSCNDCVRPEGRPKVCVVCKQLLPIDAYHRYPNFTRASSCISCRKPRPHGPKGLVRSDLPCKNCGGPIEFDEPPSRLAKRRNCSEACENASRRKKDRTCLRCKRVLPFDAFDKVPLGRNRRDSCRDCHNTDGSNRPVDLVLRPSVSQLRLNLQRQAEHRGQRMSLSIPSVRKLHQMPCELCGKHMAGILLRERDAGYLVANMVPLCRPCKRLSKMYTRQEVILQANEIAARHPLDPRQLPCRCAKSKASKTSGAARSSGSV